MYLYLDESKLNKKLSISNHRLTVYYLESAMVLFKYSIQGLIIHFIILILNVILSKESNHWTTQHEYLPLLEQELYFNFFLFFQ